MQGYGRLVLNIQVVFRKYSTLQKIRDILKRTVIMRNGDGAEGTATGKITY